MFRKPGSIITLLIGATFFMALGHALGAGMADFGLLVMGIYGLVCSALVVVLRESWMPFDILLRDRKPPQPQPIVAFDDSVAREDGSVLANTLMAKIFAAVMAVFVIVLVIQAVWPR